MQIPATISTYVRSTLCLHRNRFAFTWTFLRTHLLLKRVKLCLCFSVFIEKSAQRPREKNRDSQGSTRHGELVEGGGGRFFRTPGGFIQSAFSPAGSTTLLYLTLEGIIRIEGTLKPSDAPEWKKIFSYWNPKHFQQNRMVTSSLGIESFIGRHDSQSTNYDVQAILNLYFPEVYYIDLETPIPPNSVWNYNLCHYWITPSKVT